MGEERKSILDKLFDSVSHGVEWGVNQVRNPCPPRKKYGRRDEIPPPETEMEEKIDNEVELENKTQIDIGRGSDVPKEEFDPKFRPCEPEGPYIHPDQFRPNYNESSCYIPMQDPCRTYCCPPTKEEEEPCPPKKSYLDEPREPTCSCDFCKKNKGQDNCCPEEEKIFREENNGGRLERA